VSRREEYLDDQEEGLRQAMEGLLAGTWTALPGIVTAVQLDAGTCTVQPGVKGMVEDESGAVKATDMPVLIHVPIVWPGTSLLALTLPLKPGDAVLVVFACRAIDSWWQSGGTDNVPVEPRMHDLSDGFAFPSPMTQPQKFPNVSAENIQLRDKAGTTFLEVTPDGKVNVVATGEVNVTAPTVNIEADAINMTGAVTIDGPLTQTGGEATLTDLPVKISLHKHTEPDGETGPPIAAGP